MVVDASICSGSGDRRGSGIPVVVEVVAVVVVVVVGVVVAVVVQYL